MLCLCHLLRNSYFNRLFTWPSLVPYFNNRWRGNTGSCVVDTGVSLSTHTSPFKTNPLVQLISCWARKRKEGYPEGGDDFIGGNESRDYCKGRNCKWVSRHQPAWHMMCKNSHICDFSTNHSVIMLYYWSMGSAWPHDRLVPTGFKEQEWHKGRYTASPLLMMTHHLNWAAQCGLYLSDTCVGPIQSKNIIFTLTVPVTFIHKFT